MAEHGEPERKFAGCPHSDIRDCPLYLAAHVAGAGGCDDGDLMWGGCAADRQWPYETALARLRVTHPKLVAQCEWDATARHTREQRQRNMRAAGIH